MKTIKISNKFMKQKFHPCTPEYIAKVCKGACCESHTKERDILVTIHPTEVKRITELGGKVVDNLLQPVDKRCPFKDSNNLCILHNTSDKPFGCLASPFTIKNNMLVVRNRYRMLRCYKETKDKIPVYKAHRLSLDTIFGKEEAERICKHLDKYNINFEAKITDENYNKLIDNDIIKHKKGNVDGWG